VLDQLVDCRVHARSTVAEDEELDRVGRVAHVVPHRRTELVAPSAHERFPQNTGSVIRLLEREGARHFGVGEVDDVQAARRRLSIRRERGAAGDHRVGEAVHVGPVRLAELIPEAFRPRLIAAVDEELYDGLPGWRAPGSVPLMMAFLARYLCSPQTQDGIGDGAPGTCANRLASEEKRETGRERRTGRDTGRSDVVDARPLGARPFERRRIGRCFVGRRASCFA